MKYLKSYKIFEEIHELNTNIKELDADFVSDIIEICADLNDELPHYDTDIMGDKRELISFYSSNFRSRYNKANQTSIIEPFPDYPSISIKLPYLQHGYTFGVSKTKTNKITGYDLSFQANRQLPKPKECYELKEVALRIKDFLGDAYIAFLIYEGGRIPSPGSRNIKLNDDTIIDGIKGFQIVYDPNKLS